MRTPVIAGARFILVIPLLPSSNSDSSATTYLVALTSKKMYEPILHLSQELDRYFQNRCVLPDPLIRRACIKICEPYILSNACRSSRTNSYRHFNEISACPAWTCMIQSDRRVLHKVRGKSLNCAYKFHTNSPLCAPDRQKDEKREANILIGLSLFCLCFYFLSMALCTDGEYDKPRPSMES